MSDAVLIAIIGGAFTLIASLIANILIFITNNKKFKTEQQKLFAEQIASQDKKIDELKENQDKKLEDLEKSLHSILTTHKQTYMDEIADVKDSVTQIQAVYQQNTTIISLKIDALEKKQDQHNGLISRMYGVESSQKLLEEQLKVSNHRLSDVEEELKKK